MINKKNKGEKELVNGFLTRDDILDVNDIKSEVVEVPEWFGKVMVRGLDGVERDNYQISLIMSPGKSEEINLRNATAKLVALSIVSENGKRLFSEADVKLLGKKSGSALNRVYAVAQRLSGLSQKDIDALTENLSEGPSDNSISN